MTNDEILELWQRLNNEVFRPDADRDTPMVVQFARAVLARDAAARESWGRLQDQLQAQDY